MNNCSRETAECSTLKLISIDCSFSPFLLNKFPQPLFSLSPHFQAYHHNLDNIMCCYVVQVVMISPGPKVSIPKDRSSPCPGQGLILGVCHHRGTFEGNRPRNRAAGPGLNFILNPGGWLKMTLVVPWSGTFTSSHFWPRWSPGGRLQAIRAKHFSFRHIQK